MAINERPTPDDLELPGDDINLPLFWEDTYAIVKALIHEHPDINLEEVSLGLVYSWTVALPGFEDDRELANEEILTSIYQEWYEEVNPL